jgi:hypothetical protein
MLLAAGADATIKSVDGETALQLADRLDAEYPTEDSIPRRRVSDTQWKQLRSRYHDTAVLLREPSLTTPEALARMIAPALVTLDAKHLCVAAGNGDYVKVERLLLKDYVDPNVKDIDGSLALKILLRSTVIRRSQRCFSSMLRIRT